MQVECLQWTPNLSGRVRGGRRAASTETLTRSETEVRKRQGQRSRVIDCGLFFRYRLNIWSGIASNESIYASHTPLSGSPTNSGLRSPLLSQEPDKAGDSMRLSCYYILVNLKRSKVAPAKATIFNLSGGSTGLAELKEV